ncbi:hypothetical protein [Marinifilum sp. N1E240]|nr:hypothetical protein [Marinifilum sp. N1E240]
MFNIGLGLKIMPLALIFIGKGSKIKSKTKESLKEASISSVEECKSSV